jgi:hypothetical protein
MVAVPGGITSTERRAAIDNAHLAERLLGGPFFFMLKYLYDHY